MSIGFSGGKVRYALLPVWMLNIKYKGQNYHFSVNGQNGKVVGEYPVDEEKKKHIHRRREEPTAAEAGASEKNERMITL